MLLQDDSFLELLRSVVKDPSDKKWVVRTRELKAFHAMELTCVSKGEDLDSLPSKFVNFSNYEGMPMAGFGKEINPFLKILESRKGKKGHGAKVSSGKRNLPSTFYFEREICKLECSINYNSSPITIKGRGRSTEDSTPIL